MQDRASNDTTPATRGAAKRDAAAAAWVLSAVTLAVLAVGVLVIKSTGPTAYQRDNGDDSAAVGPTVEAPNEPPAEQAILVVPTPYAPDAASVGEPATAQREPPFAPRLN